MNTSYDNWLKRLSHIEKNYEFGPLQTKKSIEGKLHADDSPAYISPTRVIWFKDGKMHGPNVDIFGTICYYYENIRIPERFFTHKDEITFEEVLKNPNAEVRYVGMKIIGFENIEDKLRLVHADKKTGMKLFEMKNVFQDPFQILKVINSTPDKITNYRKPYYLLIPPGVKTCQDAVAWTFNMQGNEYRPSQET